LDFTEHDYQFEVDSAPVAFVHKKWVKLQDQIDISMTGEVDHRVIIGAVILIEHVGLLRGKISIEVKPSFLG
jgi:uncharacterized protein YxjI